MATTPQTYRRYQADDFTPGIYADQYFTNEEERKGLLKEMGRAYNLEAASTRGRRGPTQAEAVTAANIDAAIRARGARNKQLNRVRPLRGPKFHTGKGRKHARARYQLHDAAGLGLSMGAQNRKQAYLALAENPRAGALSNKAQRGFVAAKGGPALGHENMRQRRWRMDNLAGYERQLGVGRRRRR